MNSHRKQVKRSQCDFLKPSDYWTNITNCLVRVWLGIYPCLILAVYVLVHLLEQADAQSSEHFPVLLPELVNASQKLGGRSPWVCVLWMLLAVHCSREERGKMDFIRLSVQSIHGSDYPSLKEIFIGSNKKIKKPCRVAYSGGYAMRRHGLQSD